MSDLSKFKRFPLVEIATSASATNATPGFAAESLSVGVTSLAASAGFASARASA